MNFCKMVPMMEFCDECGNIMRVKAELDGKLLLICPVCGFEKVVEDSKIQRSELEIAIPNDEPAPFEGVIDDAEYARRGTLSRAMCPKCGHDRAYVTMMQTRAADEPPTRIYRCERCGHTWREYS